MILAELKEYILKLGYKEALFYQTLANNKIQCQLCPWNCQLREGQIGICGARQNQNDKLYSLIYNQVSSIALDPIEKKPLRHFHPGTKVLSVGTYGCNLLCQHCQNWQIAHVKQIKEQEAGIRFITPEQLIRMAKESGSAGVAWTYNEPTIWFEYAYEGAILAKQAGLYTVWVTNGYINQAPLDMIAPYLDAYRVDVKAFSTEAYWRLAKIKDFQPILAAAERAKNKWQLHVEIVTLVIPGLNDDEAQLRGIADWIVNKLGPVTPWHLNRFFPYLEFAELPITPLKTLEKAKEIGHRAGLKDVYIGNV